MPKSATALKNAKAIAIGGFDGMHIGHQKLFSALGDAGAIVVIETGYANLTPSRLRERYSHYPIMYYPLDDIRHLDGEGFISRLFETFPQLEKIVVGYDFHFGKDRRYSFKDLNDLFDGEVEIIEEVALHGDSIHSHKIRAKLEIGDVKGANAFLGHNYTLHGKIIQGQGLGKKELVATINLKTEGMLLPKEGVYASLTRIDDEDHFHPSVSFLGHRVTTDGSYAVETHILDETIVANDNASISFIAYIRENQRFDSLDALKKAINEDIKVAKRALSSVSL